MSIPAPKNPEPLLTVEQLWRIREEVNAARCELREMLAIRGDIRAIWQTPRKYFEPDDETLIPVPCERLNRLVKPLWEEFELDDPDRSAILGDIFAHGLWLEIARRELIPRRFR